MAGVYPSCHHAKYTWAGHSHGATTRRLTLNTQPCTLMLTPMVNRDSPTTQYTWKPEHLKKNPCKHSENIILHTGNPSWFSNHKVSYCEATVLATTPLPSSGNTTSCSFTSTCFPFLLSTRFQLLSSRRTSLPDRLLYGASYIINRRQIWTAGQSSARTVSMEPP